MQLPDFALEHFFARWEFTAKYMLGSSDAETHRLDEILSMADEECRAWWHGLRLGYTEVAGHPLLRGAIRQLYRRLDERNIGVFAGAEEAIFTFMNVALAPGQHAIVIVPSYQSLYDVAVATGAEVTRLHLHHHERWTLSVDRLRDAIRGHTRVIAVNFPHNPTGAHISRETFAEIVDLARECGAWLFSDEVYRFSEFDDTATLPAAADLYERAVSLGVMSKALGLAGLRIGWIAAQDRTLVERMLAFKHYLSICNSATSEVLATIALRARQRVLTRNRSIALANLERLDGFFERWQDLFDWVRPCAGTVAFPRLLLKQPIDEFAVELAESASVLIVPGTVFGHPGNHFRLGFGRADLAIALELLDRFVEGRRRR